MVKKKFKSSEKVFPVLTVEFHYLFDLFYKQSKISFYHFYLAHTWSLTLFRRKMIRQIYLYWKQSAEINKIWKFKKILILNKILR